MENNRCLYEGDGSITGRDSLFGRRGVLRATGGLLSVGVLSGTAAANGNEEKNYGNGNGLGAFLNEEAEFKENPIWTGEIADRRGQEVVDVANGVMTSVDIPDPEAPSELPFAFAPQVVKVSPGATVRWTWVSNAFFPIPHNGVSLVDEDGDPVLEPDGDPSFERELKGYKESPGADEPDEEDLPTFEVTFTERGNHLYYCTPHGAPFPVEFRGEEFYNEFGMRGAVKVTGKPL